jgi:aldehyde:ferredoxin oxidoreductase
LDYPAVDIRGTKGMALSFAVSPRGGDHLKGLPLYEVAPDVYADDIQREVGIRITPQYWLQYETKAELMRWHENWHCVVDSLGLCKLEGIALKPMLPVHFQRMLTAATGWEVDVAGLGQVGERIWNLERLFNIREGKGRADDLPPRRLLEEPISTGPAKGERLERHRYEAMLSEYYRLRGWDGETGVPTGEKLAELGLEPAEHP